MVARFVRIYIFIYFSTTLRNSYKQNLFLLVIYLTVNLSLMRITSWTLKNHDNLNISRYDFKKVEKRSHVCSHA